MAIGQDFLVQQEFRIIRVIGNGTPLQYSCLENPMDGGAWWAAVHGVAKSQTQLSNFTFTFHFHALEKEMATHSSVLAWRIPGTGQPGGLPSVGSDTTEATQQQQQQSLIDQMMSIFQVVFNFFNNVLQPSVYKCSTVLLNVFLSVLFLMLLQIKFFVIAFFIVHCQSEHHIDFCIFIFYLATLLNLFINSDGFLCVNSLIFSI